MNRNRRSIEKNARKKMTKEIRAAQKNYPPIEEIVRTDTISVKDLLRKYPKKILKKDKELIDSFEKTVEIKKKKTPHSKRTTPGELSVRDSSPAHVHPESNRWEKTLTLQNKTQQNSFRRKLIKRNRNK